MSCSVDAESFECAPARPISIREHHTSLFTRITMFFCFSARRRQHLEACGMDSQTSVGTLYQERKTYLYETRVVWTGQRIETSQWQTSCGCAAGVSGRAGIGRPSIAWTMTIDYVTAVGASRYRSCGIDYGGGPQFFRCPAFAQWQQTVSLHHT